MQQRYYDPIAGRFMSLDPVVTDANTGKSFGRYHYANNNPYRYIDRDGRDPKIGECGFIQLDCQTVGSAPSIRENSASVAPALPLPVFGVAGASGSSGTFLALLSRLLGPLGLAAVPSSLGDSSLDRRTTFWHGTDSASAVALKAGAPLSIWAATTTHIDGAVGFYLADNVAAAEFFAVRRENPAVISFRLTARALLSLEQAGSVFGPIPQGGGGGFIPGNQLYLPPRAFTVWDALRASGQID